MSDTLNLKNDPVTYIYALAEPARGNIRYIGKANDVSRRMRRHMKDARDGRADHKSRWLASMIRNGDQHGVTENVISAIKHGRAYRDEVPA